MEKQKHWRLAEDDQSTVLGPNLWHKKSSVLDGVLGKWAERDKNAAIANAILRLDATELFWLLMMADINTVVDSFCSFIDQSLIKWSISAYDNDRDFILLSTHILERLKDSKNEHFSFV